MIAFEVRKSGNSCGVLFSNADRANSKFGKDGVIPEQKSLGNICVPSFRTRARGKLLHCLVCCKEPADYRKDRKWTGAPEDIVASPNTIWQVGKCMLHIITKGRFWDENNNALNPMMATKNSVCLNRKYFYIII